MDLKELTKYETSRIIGARALQIAMNAPLLIKLNKEELEKLNYDSIKIAEIELDSGVLPISIHRPLPDKKGERLKRVRGGKLSDQKTEELENREEDEIVKDGEIMELANPDDESEEDPEKVSEVA